MITLEQFVPKYNGKKVGDGQCGTLVRQYWIEVDGTNPPSYLNSRDYWFNPVPGYDKIPKGQPIQDGDIGIYDGHGSYPEGHSDIRYKGQYFEQNADPDGSPAHLYPRADTYLLGHLRKQGSEEPMGKWDNGKTYNLLFHSCNAGIAKRAQDANYVGYFGAEEGKDAAEAFDEIIASPQYDFLVAEARGSASNPDATVLKPGDYRVQ